ncbi:LOW QUALITY PROTEIN: uncharacterized protein [Setaria viridis]|uniref:LOW QUALITY PROTEIN: uncharacterized protein n=1 Tax=Setaria viridis TaxID=4556 RepID=UPI003B3A54E8
MEPSGLRRSRVPFTDLTNTTIQDPNECDRERKRFLVATMSGNKRIQYNSTCRERRMRRKTEQGAIQHISNHHQGDSVHMEADENDGWLHRGDLGENKYRLDRLVECIFPNLNANMTNKEYITSRTILSTRNDWVDNINTKMIDMFQGREMVYHSFDSAIDDPHNYYPSEFLNTLTPNGFPPHLLKLKIGCPIILLRNIDPANGLCNGTRLVVRGFQRNSIDAEIVLGQHAKKRVFLPRIPLCPYDDEMFPFQFKMKQFPIRVSFAMTINKSQGQTIPNVGVYLPSPVFSHGQLYVAMSRATARTNIKILTLPPNAEADEEQTKKKEKKKSL